MTPTGLLMEGVYTHDRIVGEMAIFLQLTAPKVGNGPIHVQHLAFGASFVTVPS